MNTIGEQIGQLAGEAVAEGRLTESRLTRGLITREMLHKLEDGSIPADIRLVRVLLQRLGKSPNKLEFILSQDDLKIKSEQLAFDDSINRHDSKTAIKTLNLLESNAPIPGNEKIAEMYALWNRACYEMYFEKDYDAALEHIDAALEVTLPKWKEKGLSYFAVSSIETDNLLAYC